MRTVSIRELHLHTGKWVREASIAREPLVVLDRGRPAARLVPFEQAKRYPFHERKKVAGFDDLPRTSIDSGKILEEDRR
jgi:antitoxin (DNA-binding transcriptional repressor) of toxin-antitoxin stability system